MTKRPYIGVGVIILDNNNSVLLGLRNGSHGAGVWGLPGGHVDFGETLQDTAIREVQEETNLNINNLKLISVSDDIMPEENKHYVSIGFICKEFSGKLKKMEKDKCLQWRWFPIGALPDNIFTPSKHVINNYISKTVYKNDNL